MKSTPITVEVLKNVINEELATFRMSLNQDLGQRFDDFAEKYKLSELVTKDDLKLALENHPTHQDLSAAVGDIVDAMDKSELEHLKKYHHVSL
ncbi:MAG: hypothetical protein AAB909_00290 [Patescibacteria group bacterium]